MLVTASDGRGILTYGLCNIVYDHCTVGVSVVHWREGLVSFLTGCVPYLEFYGCGVVKADRLGEEGSADSGFSVVVELVLLT